MQQTSKLDQTIEENDASLHQMIELADEVIDLCRLSRQSILENTDVIRSSERAIDEERGEQN